MKRIICFKDFLPQMTEAPRLFKVAEYEPFELAVMTANEWIEEHSIDIVNMETVVLPNVWSRFEEGTTDPSLGTSGDSPSHWHQFVRVWYRANVPIPKDAPPVRAESNAGNNDQRSQSSSNDSKEPGTDGAG
ncbi:MAG: hypothetical protein ACI9G1_001708 [Pirellulaceae bacterium]|jgi:hypothetical protein